MADGDAAYGGDAIFAMCFCCVYPQHCCQNNDDALMPPMVIRELL